MELLVRVYSKNNEQLYARNEWEQLSEPRMRMFIHEAIEKGEPVDFDEDCFVEVKIFNDIDKNFKKYVENFIQKFEEIEEFKHDFLYFCYNYEDFVDKK